MSLPLGFYPMHKINGEKVYLILKDIMDLFKTHTDINIHWGSSDGFQSHKTFLTNIKKHYSAYLHFFDVVHIVKNLRNHVLLKAMRVDDDVRFSLKTLRQLRDSQDDETRRKFRNLVPHDPVPVDKMNVKMVDMLLTPGLLAALKASTPAAKKLGEYFEQMKNLKEGMMDNDLTWDERLEKLEGAERYFYKLKDSLGNMHHQIATTIDSVKALHQQDRSLTAFNVFGTLIVENFFSPI